MRFSFWTEKLRQRMAGLSRRRRVGGSDADIRSNGRGRPFYAEQCEERCLPSVSALLYPNAFNPALQDLTILTSSDDDVTVTVSGGFVQILTGNGGGAQTNLLGAPQTLTPASLARIDISGSDATNRINVSGVTTANGFSASLVVTADAGDSNDLLDATSSDIAVSLNGGNGADTITGGTANDTLLGGDGADVITGGVGNDSLLGGNGADTVNGGAGLDTLNGGDGADSLNAGDDNDNVFGANGADSIDGGLGDDTLNGDGGNDTVNGNAGNDTILGGADQDSLLGGDGNDSINAQGGNDTLDGEAGDDSLTGDVGTDSLRGSDGNDVINGGDGNDTANGGSGNDSVLGGSGNDSIEAGDGNDTINGQSGNDTLRGQSGTDSLDGGDGDDFITEDSSSSAILPTLSVANGVVTEGNSGSANVTFTVTLSQIASSVVTVAYVTADGTAVSASDYNSQSGTLTFLPGQTVQSVTVQVIGDALVESSEVFFLQLSAPTNAALLVPEGIATISDDDASPSRLLATRFQGELFEVDTTTGAFTLIGNTGLSLIDGLTIGPGNTLFTVSNLPKRLSTINPVTAAATTVGTLTPAPISTTEGDLVYDVVNNVIYAVFSPNPPNTPDLLRIDPATGNVTNLGSLLTGGDAIAGAVEFNALAYRGNELYGIIAGNALGADTILNDALLRVDVTTREVTVVGSLGFDLSTGTAALVYDGANDVFYLTGGTGTPNDFYRVNPNTGAATLIGNTGFGSISGLAYTVAPVVAPIALSVSDVTISEGNSGSVNAAFTVSLSRPATSVVTVQVTTRNGSANSSSDYTTLTNTLTFTPGQLSQTVNIPVTTDTSTEANEVFFLQLTNPTGALLLDSFGIATIVDDDFNIDPNTLLGGNGNDTLFGGNGDEILNGGSGNDSINASAGNDTVFGGSGADSINGGDGNDSLNGQGGNDLLDGGAGDDQFIWNGASGASDTVSNSSGFDTAVVNGTGGVETLAIGQDASGLLTITDSGFTLTVQRSITNVIVNGNGGDDVVTIGSLSNVTGTVLTINGGDGNDSLDASGAVLGFVRMGLNGQAGDDSLTGGDGTDTLDGGDGNDSLAAGAGNDSVIGGAGDDVLSGQDGNDTLNGGDGDDFAAGGNGNDSMLGGDGNDSLQGNAGNDTLSGQAGDDNLVDTTGNDSLDGGNGFDTLDSGAGDDTLDGGFGDDSLTAGAGNDKLRGGDGNDTLDAGDGDDELNAGDGDDQLIGGAGNDGLSGGDGDDLINGGAGNDIITGNDGNDSLLGGAGIDTLLGGDGDDSINGQGGADIVGGDEGVDTLVLDASDSVNELFALSQTLLDKLDGV